MNGCTFVLRSIIPNEGVTNRGLGSAYCINLVGSANFERDLSLCGYPEQYKETIYGFVHSVDNDFKWPLVKNSQYFIMTGEGDTFERVRSWVDMEARTRKDFEK